MAKKTTKTETGGVSESDVQTLAAIKGLERSLESLRETLGNKRAKLAPGTYALSLSVSVNGDISVAPDVETSGREGPSVKDRELLVGVLVGMGPGGAGDAETLVGEAMAAVKDAEATGAGANRYEAAEALLDEIVERQARRRKLWRTTPAGWRAGATTGEPGVDVSGSVNGRNVSVNVRASGVGAAEPGGRE